MQSYFKFCLFVSSYWWIISQSFVFFDNLEYLIQNMIHKTSQIYHSPSELICYVYCFNLTFCFILHSIYQVKEITKIVNNNIMNSIQM